MKPCKCGCGVLIEDIDKSGRPHDYKAGHNHRKAFGRKPLLNPIVPCACGCGNNITKYDRRGRERKFHPRHRDWGPTHPRWKGGIWKTIYGYVQEWKPDHPNANNVGYVLQHRLVLEQKLGRYLTEEEQTHHINGKRDDNRPENLQLIDAHEHGFITATEVWRKRKELRS